MPRFTVEELDLPGAEALSDSKMPYKTRVSPQNYHRTHEKYDMVNKTLANAAKFGALTSEYFYRGIPHDSTHPVFDLSEYNSLRVGNLSLPWRDAQKEASDWRNRAYLKYSNCPGGTWPEVLKQWTENRAGFGSIAREIVFNGTLCPDSAACIKEFHSCRGGMAAVGYSACAAPYQPKSVQDLIDCTILTSMAWSLVKAARGDDWNLPYDDIVKLHMKHVVQLSPLIAKHRTAWTDQRIPVIFPQLCPTSGKKYPKDVLAKLDHFEPDLRPFLYHQTEALIDFTFYVPLPAVYNVGYCKQRRVLLDGGGNRWLGSPVYLVDMYRAVLPFTETYIFDGHHVDIPKDQRQKHNITFYRCLPACANAPAPHTDHSCPPGHALPLTTLAPPTTCNCTTNH